MKLIVIAQKIDLDDDNLSFFHGWAEKLSAKLEKLSIIALAGGRYDLPESVEVFSLGKEKGFSKLRQLWRLQKFLLRRLPEADGIFVHMCPIYAIASFPLARIFRKKMVLWYTHKSVNWELKLASKLVSRILTASEESCRLKNRKKIMVTGHGINIDQFRPAVSLNKSPAFKIISAGRIVPSKDFQTLIEAVDILINRDNLKDLQAEIIGTPVLDQEKQYLAGLEKSVREKKLAEYIRFLPGVPYARMPQYYQEADLLVNASQTGSIDKVVLEAMASGCLVLTCNESFFGILEDKYLFEKKNASELAFKIKKLKEAGQDESLREIVLKRHNLDNLIDKICREF